MILCISIDPNIQYRSDIQSSNKRMPTPLHRVFVLLLINNQKKNDIQISADCSIHFFEFLPELTV